VSDGPGVTEARRQRRTPRPGGTRGNPPDRADDDARETRGIAVGAVAGGWFLFALVGPLAVFLTWFGDCVGESCPVASELDRTIYTADLLFWLALPAVAFLAHRARPVAALVVSGIGLSIVAQGIASVLGARGFQAFFLVIPAGGLIAMGGALELAAARLARQRPR
jgi:hypothetical protein